VTFQYVQTDPDYHVQTGRDYKVLEYDLEIRHPERE
jgi:hypothetical protein